MKIRSIELFQVPPRWLFLKMTTESGLVGWGEPVVEGRAATVAACVREMTPSLIGKSAGDVEDVFQMLYLAGAATFPLPRANGISPGGVLNLCSSEAA